MRPAQGHTGCVPTRRSHQGQARTLLAEIVSLRCAASPGLPALSMRGGRHDRDLIAIARELGVHVCWHEDMPDDPELPGDDLWQCACLCGWRGEASGDLAARAVEAVGHVMSGENFAH